MNKPWMFWPSSSFNKAGCKTGKKHQEIFAHHRSSCLVSPSGVLYFWPSSGTCARSADSTVKTCQRLEWRQFHHRRFVWPQYGSPCHPRPTGLSCCVVASPAQGNHHITSHKHHRIIHEYPWSIMIHLPRVGVQVDIFWKNTPLAGWLLGSPEHSWSQWSKRISNPRSHEGRPWCFIEKTRWNHKSQIKAGCHDSELAAPFGYAPATKSIGCTCNAIKHKANLQALFVRAVRPTPSTMTA